LVGEPNVANDRQLRTDLAHYDAGNQWRRRQPVTLRRDKEDHEQASRRLARSTDASPQISSGYDVRQARRGLGLKVPEVVRGWKVHCHEYFRLRCKIKRWMVVGRRSVHPNLCRYTGHCYGVLNWVC